MRGFVTPPGVLHILSDILGSAYAASAVSVLPNNGLYGSVTKSLIISAWAFGFALNVFVTGAIVTRLLRMGRTMTSLTAISTNRFATTIYIVVESGAISAVTNVVVLALFASNSPVALSGMDVAAQLIVRDYPPSYLACIDFDSTGIDATLDHGAGWANPSRSYCKRRFLENDTHSTGQYHVPRGDSWRLGAGSCYAPSSERRQGYLCLKIFY